MINRVHIHTKFMGWYDNQIMVTYHNFYTHNQIMVTYHNFYTHNNLVSLATTNNRPFSNVGSPFICPLLCHLFFRSCTHVLAIDKKAGNHNLRASHRLASSNLVSLATNGPFLLVPLFYALFFFLLCTYLPTCNQQGSRQP